jgi:hypothetical protein
VTVENSTVIKVISRDFAPAKRSAIKNTNVYVLKYSYAFFTKIDNIPSYFVYRFSVANQDTLVTGPIECAISLL